MKVQYHDGCSGRSTFVLGDEFGPSMVAHRSSESDAMSEYDERFGERVDLDDPSLDDYDDEDARGQFSAEDWEAMTPSARRVAAAEHAGDVRTNDGGTVVWVNHHEWMREFQSLRAAVRFCRECAGQSALEIVRG